MAWDVSPVAMFCFLLCILDFGFILYISSCVCVVSYDIPFEIVKTILHVFSNCLPNLIIQEQTPFDDVNLFHEGYFICANFTFLDKVPPIFLYMCFFSFTLPRGKGIGVETLERKTLHQLFLALSVVFSEPLQTCGQGK